MKIVPTMTMPKKAFGVLHKNAKPLGGSGSINTSTLSACGHLSDSPARNSGLECQIEVPSVSKDRRLATSKILLIWPVLLLSGLLSCSPVEHNTAELVDPWLRDRTLVSITLAGQAGPSVVSTDWRDDSKGSVSVTLISAMVDLSAVTVEAIEVADMAEYTATASVKPGDTIDLSDGEAEIVLTAYNGDTRTYVITWSDMTLFNATFTLAGVQSSLGWGEATYCFVAGGPDNDVRTGNIYDHLGAAWVKDDGRWPNDEKDNIVSFKGTEYDAERNLQCGTFINTPGEDGLYANFVWIQNDGSYYEKDCNSIYRLIPKGRGRWSNEVGTDIYTFYEYDDEEYGNPVGEVQFLNAGTYNIEYPGATVPDWVPNTVTVPDVGLTRTYEYTSFVDLGGIVSQYMAENVRQVWWLLNKESDQCLPNHDELIAEIE